MNDATKVSKKTKQFIKCIIEYVYIMYTLFQAFEQHVLVTMNNHIRERSQTLIYSRGRGVKPDRMKFVRVGKGVRVIRINTPGG